MISIDDFLRELTYNQIFGVNPDFLGLYGQANKRIHVDA
jgi:hypothetical protein